MGDFMKWGDPSNEGGGDFEIGGWYPFTDYEIVSNK